MNFCSGCGTPAETGPGSADRRVAGVFVVGAVFIALFGLLGLFPLLKILLDSRLDPSAVGILVIAYLITWVTMFSVMTRLGWKLLGAGKAQKLKDSGGERYREPAPLAGVRTAQLHTGDPGFGSVTDSTTRTLDEILVERK